MVSALSLGYQVCLALAGMYLVAVLKPSLQILALQLQNVVWASGTRKCKMQTSCSLTSSSVENFNKMGEGNITAMFLSDWRFSLRILAEEVANLIEPNLLQPSVAS